ncbi:MAG: L-aspartate oxidase [Crocinitomicaceae bacterium]|nr:L-aspartate oxidase [Crocinitomicaceae bacterium]
MRTDFLVIGTGLAGLNYILKVGKNNPRKKIIVVTKSNKEESNTSYAQGGVAIVQDPKDSFSNHIADTLISGDGLCDEAIVDMVVKEGPNCLDDFIDMGVTFDRNASGKLDLALEGGHSKNRVVHFQDATGYEIQKALLQQVIALENVELLDHHFALELITENNTCLGALILDEKKQKVRTILSKITLLATGGIGQVYAQTTNPIIATGDGIAMAHTAGAKIKDMEFVQFHPTALYSNKPSSSFLISEAVRGFGGKLKTNKGVAFMHKYDKRGDLASRDIVARAIHEELKKSKDSHVSLDCTHLNYKKFRQHFPTIIAECEAMGINPQKDMIPVVPAQHYICGGIATDAWGETSIHRLFACGECAHTGLHGANRLASNSLLEAYVFSSRSAQRSVELIKKDRIQIISNKPVKHKFNGANKLCKLGALHVEIKTIMWESAGIVRNYKELNKALKQLQKLKRIVDNEFQFAYHALEMYELRNLTIVAELILTASMEREENRGGYFNSDLITEPRIIKK